MGAGLTIAGSLAAQVLSTEIRKRFRPARPKSGNSPWWGLQSLTIFSGPSWLCEPPQHRLHKVGLEAILVVLAPG